MKETEIRKSCKCFVDCTLYQQMLVVVNGKRNKQQ